MPVTAILVFACLGFVQQERTLAHVFLTAILVFALSVIPNVLILGQTFVAWRKQGVWIGGTAIIGFGVAALIRTLTESKGARLANHCGWSGVLYLIAVHQWGTLGEIRPLLIAKQPEAEAG